jgi:hypothetical protein
MFQRNETISVEELDEMVVTLVENKLIYSQ